LAEESPAPQDPLADYRNAIKAFQDKNYSVYLAEIRKAVQKIPNHPGLIYHFARALALNGQDKDALDALATVAKLGEGIKIEEDQAFASIRANSDFVKVSKEFDRNGRREITYTSCHRRR
jgi:hypothetical protein